jgi:hypothetical protein
MRIHIPCKWRGFLRYCRPGPSWSSARNQWWASCRSHQTYKRGTNFLLRCFKGVSKCQQVCSNVWQKELLRCSPDSW